MRDTKPSDNQVKEQEIERRLTELENLAQSQKDMQQKADPPMSQDDIQALHSGLDGLKR